MPVLRMVFECCQDSCLPRAASGTTTRALHFFCLAEFCDCPWRRCDHLIDRCLFLSLCSGKKEEISQAELAGLCYTFRGTGPAGIEARIPSLATALTSIAHTTALTEFPPSPSRPLLADLASRSGSAAWSWLLADALLEAQSLG